MTCITAPIERVSDRVRRRVTRPAPPNPALIRKREAGWQYVAAR
ncbi:hypothetical protein OEM_15510 [Mycobacterium intracellulare subsp. yongonense 05-1390]|nr:hypothetical protein OEM_15510 [Mycobacterium intracellulare subsp. yongonense 05-1390]ARR77201.1 hypothetical protein MOTT12_01537 [Mycobacterium intracellulare subsp. yongonense]ARR82337.1 hypothetical protein MOTT27_01516 [Mycobacterium intracellulare subsp. yongonense]